MEHLRKNLIARRYYLSKNFTIQNQLQLVLQKWINLHCFKKIAIYWPIQDEFNLIDCMLNWVKKDKEYQLLLPHSVLNKPLYFKIWNYPNIPPHKGLYNIPEPEISSKIVIPEAVLIPCLGWQKHNKKIFRVGYGGGYYDKTIKKYRIDNNNQKITFFIGISYENLEISKNLWCPYTYDMPLDGLITESGII